MKVQFGEFFFICDPTELVLRLEYVDTDSESKRPSVEILGSSGRLKRL